MESAAWPDIWRLARRLLHDRTGLTVTEWRDRIRGIDDEPELRRRLNEQGVTGYPQMLLVLERFGFPAVLPSPEQMVDALYADRPALRPIHDRVMEAVSASEDVLIAAQPTHVSLETPLRQFAVIKPTTVEHVDLAFRLPGRAHTARFVDCGCAVNDRVSHRVELTSPDQVDPELHAWLRDAYDAALTDAKPPERAPLPEEHPRAGR